MLQRAKIEQLLPENGESFDVIITGGGPAGIGAALAAATNGAKTLILEDRASFGGVASVSGWMPVNRLYTNGSSRGDIHEMFISKLHAMSPDACCPGRISWFEGEKLHLHLDGEPIPPGIYNQMLDVDGLHIHPDYLRLGVLELLEETGCYYLLRSPVTGVEMKGSSIAAVVCDGKFGRKTYTAKVYVDASGDGDVAFYAGAQMQKGRENDGYFMPATMGFVVSNVDEERLFAAQSKIGFGEFADLIKSAASEGYATSTFYSFDRTTVPGVVSVNNSGQAGLGVVDATNLRDVNLSMRAGLQVAMDFVKIVREKKLPGLENCHLVRTGSELGIRETRRIVGDYVLTLEDTQGNREFEDTVARRYGTIDTGGLREEKNHHGSIQNGHAYPYRCMLPQGLDGLLVAGRCASLTHIALTICKSMGNMMAIGTAAGVAAALSAKEGVHPRDLDIGKLQNRLREMKVPI